MKFMRKGAVLTALIGGIMLAGAGVAAADADATGAAIGSPGVLSGNLVQVPIHVPVNVCGNSVNVIGALNPAFGNSCSNIDSGHRPLFFAHHHKDHADHIRHPEEKKDDC